METNRSDQYSALGVALTAGALFVSYVVFLFPPELQFPKYPNAVAQYIAGTLPPERITDFSPLYFYLHLLSVRIFNGSPFLIASLQILATAGSSALLFLLLRRHCNALVALAGVAAFMLNRSLAIYTCIFEPEALLVCFLLLFLWVLDTGTKHSEWLAGLALACCILTRPNLVPMMVVVPAYLYLRSSAHYWQRSALLFLLFPLLALIALSWRNYAVGSGWSPVVMNPGFVFFESNNPLASGQSAVYPPLVAELRNEIQDQPDNPHAVYRMLARIEAGEQLSTAEVNRFWWTKGMNFIVEYPGRWLRHELHKFYVLWHEHRRYDLLEAFNFDRLLQKRHLPSVPFALLSSCALFGLLTCLREWRRYLLYYALFALMTVSMLIFYVSDRQRLAMMPLFVIFASVGMGKMLTYNGRTRFALTCGMLLLAVLISLPSDRMRDDLHLWDSDQRCNQLWHYAAGMQGAGNTSEAADAYALSFAVAPWVEDLSRPDHVSYGYGGFAGRAAELWPKLERSGASADFDRGIVLLAAGKLDDAERIFNALRSAGRYFDRGHLHSSLPEYYLGRVAVRRGDIPRARRWFENALESAPGEPFVLAQLAALTGQREYRDRLLRYFGSVETDWLLGRALLEQGNAPEAQATLARLVAGLPDFRRGNVYLAAAYGATGHAELGAQLYLRSIENRPAPVMLEVPILALFSQLARTQQGSYQAQYQNGLVLSQYGYFRESLTALERGRLLQQTDSIAREIQIVREHLK